MVILLYITWLWDLLSNFGDALELQVPNYIWKDICGWSNYSCMVTSLKASEKNVGNRGSKSVFDLNIGEVYKVL